MSTTQDQAKVSTATPAQPIEPAVDVAPAPKSASDSGSKPRPHDAAGPAPKIATSTKRPQPATSTQVQNPTYINAVDDLAIHFRRLGEVSTLLGRAADGGLAAFKIYSSEEYNRASSSAFAIFKAALNALPAAAVLAEIMTGAKMAQSVVNIENGIAAATAAHKAKSAIERGAKGAEDAKKVLDGVESAGQLGEGSKATTEAQERGNFELEAIHSLADLQVEALEKRWQGEDKARKILRDHQFDEGYDLGSVVSKAVKECPLPDVGALKSILTEAAEEFELRLYLDYYIASGRVTYETVDNEGTTTEHFHGLPAKVQDRLFNHFHAKARVFATPGFKKTHRTHTYTGRMQ